MISIFKKAHVWVPTHEKKTIEEMRGMKPKVKSITEKMIEEIHHSFYTEVDNILANAKISRSLETNKQNLINKRDRLVKQGFINSSEVKSADAEIERLRNLQQENEEKAKIIRAIEYFSHNYFNYKFITQESVLKICQKYNLIYGTIDKYIGTVPDINLKHIENFKVKDEDRLWLESHNGRWNKNIFEVSHKQMQDKVAKYEKEREDYYEMDYEMRAHLMRIGSSRNNYNFSKAPLEIVAPLKDFDTKDMKLDGFKLTKVEIPDPVVLQPVMFEGVKYYLVVTAWGLEASDEGVLNHRYN
jgi:hypothetical protein